MLTKKEKETIIRCAKKYSVDEVFLFGSSVEKSGRANDIDLAVRGIKSDLFFEFYAELFKLLTKPVDLIDLDEADSYFTKRILKEGEVIYGTQIRAA